MLPMTIQVEKEKQNKTKQSHLENTLSVQIAIMFSEAVASPKLGLLSKEPS